MTSVCLSGDDRERKTSVLAFPCLHLHLEKSLVTVARQPSLVSMQRFYVSVREMVMMSCCGGGGSELFLMSSVFLRFTMRTEKSAPDERSLMKKAGNKNMTQHVTG